MTLRDPIDASSLGESGPGLHVGQSNAHQALGLVPDLAGCGRADLIDEQRDDRRCVEVGDHRRCSATRSDTGPAVLRGFGRARPRWLAGVTRPSAIRSEEHTSELQSLLRISYSAFCLKTTTLTC